MKEILKIIFGSIGAIGIVVICAIVFLVLYLLGAVTVFVLKWGTIATILIIGVICIIKNMDKPKK
jgi:hypothetical protein